ncbi:MAG: hypothetical protein ACM3Q2_10760 [Syntrophothermus sp.]
MADINIQPRKPSPWSYVLYGVALAAVVFLVYRNVHQSKAPLQTQAIEVDTSRAAGSVKAFLTFLNGEASEVTGGTESSENSPQYAPYGLHLLSAAIGAIVSRDEPENKDLVGRSNDLMQISDNINDNWDMAVPADTLRTALISASGIITELQSRHYPEMKDVAEKARKTAESLKPDRKASEQVSVIKDFYEQSGVILRNMAQSKSNAKV